MPLESACERRERGTTRLIGHVAMVDRLTRDPCRRVRDVLEQELGREMARLAVAAVATCRARAVGTV